MLMLTKITNTIPPETSIARAASLPICKHVLILRDSATVPFDAVQVHKFLEWGKGRQSNTLQTSYVKKKRTL